MLCLSTCLGVTIKHINILLSFVRTKNFGGHVAICLHLTKEVQEKNK